MRAVVVEALEGPRAAVIRDIPIPEGSHRWAHDRRLLVEVHAAGVSFIDPLQTRGKYQDGASAPYVAGSELAGVIVEAPSDSLYKAGDRVAGVVVRGAMAEFALAAEDYLIQIPDGMSFVEAASIYMNYATAWFAFERMAISAGDSVLITGAAGGVGSAALDLARVYGYESMGLVSSGPKAELARRCGARHVLRLETNWLEQLWQLTGGKGVHGLMDMVGGDGFTDALRALRIGGRGIVVGFAGGRVPELKTNRLLLRNLTLSGINMAVMETAQPGTLKRIQAGVQDLLDQNQLRAVVGEPFPFERSADAMQEVEERRSLGKVVVTVRDD